MLSRYGIVRDDAAKAALKTADDTERLSIILAAFTEKVGGAAVRDAESLTGAWARLGNQLGEAQEIIGGLVTGNEDLRQSISSLATSISGLNSIVREAQEATGGWTGRWIAFAAGLGPAINMLQALRSVTDQLRKPEAGAPPAWIQALVPTGEIAPDLTAKLDTLADELERLGGGGPAPAGGGGE